MAADLKRAVRLMLPHVKGPESTRREIRHLLDETDKPFGMVASDAVYDHGALQKVAELREMLEVTAAIEPRVIVEIGSDRGGTLYAWTHAFPDAIVISVDLHSGRPRWGATCVIGDSHSEATLMSCLDALGTRQIDVLFIDADHSYQAVRADSEMYGPFVRKGGIIAFHDVTPAMGHAGSHKFWQEVKATYPTRWREIVDEPSDVWGGIGVLYV